MLKDFVVAHKASIISRCQEKVASRSSSGPSLTSIDHGVPMFLDQLVEELLIGLSPSADISKTAAEHGHDLLIQGLTPSQVVHDYGDVCQTITEMAIETQAPISSDDFRMLNRCLDDAIASAITQYGSERDASAKSQANHEGDRVRVLGDAMRASVLAARVAFEAVQSGKVGCNGSTGSVLERSLKAIEDLNEHLQAEVAEFRRRRSDE